jgi:hypothetical protein
LFVSGPYVKAYRARAAEDGRPLGIRCVKFANLAERPGTRGVAFVWYGEDAMGGRHFGECFIAESGSLPAHAVSLNDGTMPARLSFSAGDELARLTVTGDWDEEWELCEGGVFEDFTGTRDPITPVGTALRAFSVRNRDGTPGQGVRLMLSSGSWLGAGQWRGIGYLHLGTYIGDPVPERRPVKFGAADICHLRGFCGWVDWGQMLVRPAELVTADAWEVVGLWTEEWTLHRAPSGWVPAGEVADLTVLPCATEIGSRR